ncbi:MAG: LysR family transcriptional regulator [Tabrizicola sp.]|nr:LysR family transcriptional regulator [Tabrizicola sp.]
MQLDWDHLRYLLALRRAGTFAGAARLLQVDDTTVSRRLAAIRDRLGADLIRRGPEGQIGFTRLGEELAGAAERMEAALADLPDLVASAEGVVPATVRLTAVPFLVNRLLVPFLQPLLRASPEVTVELIPSGENLSLSRHEADLALRLARPAGQSTRLWTRRLGSLRHAVFARQGSAPDAPLISYVEELSHLPQARWLDQKIRAGQRRAGLRVTDAETALQAAKAGLGAALLPEILGRAEPDLTTVRVEGSMPARNIWLIGHSDQRRIRPVRSVVDWLLTLPL